MPRRLCLLVDDDLSIRSFVKAILLGEDYEVLEAEGGRRALQITQALDGNVDLVISDVRMPDGDGLSFARAVRELFPSVPVILISAHCEAQFEFDLLEKPFSWSTLAGKIRRIVASRAA